MDGIQIQTGVLPNNIVSLSFGDDSRYAVVEFPDEYADITYMSTTYEHFPLPRLLFGFKLENSGRISAVNLGVPALGKLTEKTPMFYYPLLQCLPFFPLCGANSLPHIPALYSLQNLPHYILSLPDNDDRLTHSIPAGAGAPGSHGTPVRQGSAILLRPCAGSHAGDHAEKLYIGGKKMTEKQAKLLAYPFTADEIEWRVLLTTKDKSKGLVAAYIDSRAIQKRLDDVLGRENWKNHFITMPGNSNSTTAHICEISIYYPERPGMDHQKRRSRQHGHRAHQGRVVQRFQAGGVYLEHRTVSV